jgi:DNA-binding response OmpR family regulator
MAHILVIDDEPELVWFVQRALEADGHRVSNALDGAEGLALAITMAPDLVVLDLRMPGVDGRSVLAGLRAVHPDVPVMVLSAEADVGARVELLEAGAVDFLAKPFAVRELLVRVRNRLSPSAHDETGRRDVVRVGQMALDVHARTFTFDGRMVNLSQREFLLLRHLMRRSDQVCSREELLSEVWGYSFDPATNVVDVCVARLRHKINGDLIRTVRNVGYQLQSS